MSNFPGNPYVNQRFSDDSKGEAGQIARAILALVFEVRTANILEAAKPIVVTGDFDRSEIAGKMAEAGKRLGYGGSVKENGQVVE